MTRAVYFVKVVRIIIGGWRVTNGKIEQGRNGGHVIRIVLYYQTEATKMNATLLFGSLLAVFVIPALVVAIAWFVAPDSRKRLLRGYAITVVAASAIVTGVSHIPRSQLQRYSILPHYNLVTVGWWGVWLLGALFLATQTMWFVTYRRNPKDAQRWTWVLLGLIFFWMVCVRVQ